MFTSRLVKSLLALCATGATVQALPAMDADTALAMLEDRGLESRDFIFDAFVAMTAGATGGEWAKLFGDSYPPCCGGMVDCWAFGGKLKGIEDKFQVCYTPGEDFKWDYGNVDTFKCLVDLHHKQADKCIDTRNSPCKGKGGGIGNVYKSSAFFGAADAPKLTADQAKLMKAANFKFKGQKIATKWGVHFDTIHGNGVVTAELNVRFAGQTQC